MANILFKRTIEKVITDEDNRTFVDCTGDYNPLHKSEVMKEETMIAGKYLEAMAIEYIRQHFPDMLEKQISTGFGNPLFINQTARFDITGYDDRTVEMTIKNTSLKEDAKPVLKTKISLSDELEYKDPIITKTYTRKIEKSDVDRYNEIFNLPSKNKIPLSMALALSAPALLDQYEKDPLIRKDMMYAFILSNVDITAEAQNIPITNIDFGIQRISKDSMTKRIRLSLEANANGTLLYSANYGLVLTNYK